jgi:hypothetical protein
MTSSNWIVTALLGSVLTLTACGGGGGCAGSSSFNANSGCNATTANDLSITSSANQLGNTASSKVTLTVTALDSGKRAVPEIPVTVSVDKGSDAVVTQVNTKTDTQGKLTADVTVGANRANRLVTLVVTSGSITRTTSIQVVGASITATVTPPVLDPGAAGTVRYRVVDQTSNAMSGQPVQITAVGLTPPTISAVTDSNGEYVFRYIASTATGAYTIAATISGATNEQIVNVQPASTVPPASGVITSASVSANPSVVPVNASGTQNRSEIRALFVGAGNAPIRNVRARFDLNGDGNSIGGTIVSGSTVLYSDSNGVATTAYIPGSRTSPTNGVSVRVCYGNTDAELANGNCPNAAFVTLTVINDALGVTIGTDNKIIIDTARLIYIRKYVVQVVDSAGLAKADVNISASVDLPWFYKGRYALVSTGSGSTAVSGWQQQVNIACFNEDLNRNGVLEAGEDLDRDGRLEPGKSDVAVKILEAKTGADGKALIQIEYPQNFGSWVSARITVAASGVLGTEGRASFLEDPVGVPADAVKDAEVAPPFVISPYGISGADIVIDGVTRNGCYRSE